VDYELIGFERDHAIGHRPEPLNDNPFAGLKLVLGCCGLEGDDDRTVGT
jgi:hypothetical protein